MTYPPPQPGQRPQYLGGAVPPAQQVPAQYRNPPPWQPPPHPPYNGYPPQPKRSRNAVWITIGTLLVVVGVGVGLWFVLGATAKSSPDQEVRKTITDFAEAVDTANGPEMLGLMCAAEARQIEDGEDFDPSDDSTIDPGPRRAVDITDVKINGDTATDTVTRPPDGPHRFRLAKEDGTWKMCNSGPVSIGR